MTSQETCTCVGGGLDGVRRADFELGPSRTEPNGVDGSMMRDAFGLNLKQLRAFALLKEIRNQLTT